MAYGAPARSGEPRPRTWPTGTTPPPPRKGHFSEDILTDGFGRPGGPPQAPKPVYELSRCVDPTENARFSVSAGLGSPEDLSGTREWPISASRQAIRRSPRRGDPHPCRGAFAERNGPFRRSSDACIELCRDRPDRGQRPLARPSRSASPLPLRRSVRSDASPASAYRSRKGSSPRVRGGRGPRPALVRAHP